MNGALIRRMRTERGVTQRVVAAATGLTEATLFCLENGARNNPQLKTLLAVADYYGVEPDALLNKD